MLRENAMQALAESEHQQHMDRIGERQCKWIHHYADTVGNDDWHMQDMTDYVLARVKSAPDSPGRMLRDMRRRGELNYECVSRAKSLYRFIPFPVAQVREWAEVKRRPLVGDKLWDFNRDVWTVKHVDAVGVYLVCGTRVYAMTRKEFSEFAGWVAVASGKK
jgi:hypothetical protein